MADRVAVGLIRIIDFYYGMCRTYGGLIALGVYSLIFISLLVLRRCKLNAFASLVCCRNTGINFLLQANEIDSIIEIVKFKILDGI